MKGFDKVTAARVRLLFRNVFFGTIATGLILRETDAVPTASTDGVYLLFNPKFTDTLSKGEINFVVAHEVMHLVFLTHLRMGNKDHDVWNMATDYTINQVLVDEGFQIPEGGLLEEEYRDWSSEKIYNYLMENPDKQPETGEGWDIGGVMPGGSLGEKGEPNSGAPMTAEELATTEAKMKAKIQSAAMAAKKAGNLPGSIERLVNKICAPKANWKDILQRFINEKAFNDWEYGTCNTRLLSQYGIIAPILGGEALGELALIVDTSGSIREEELSQFAGEISDILENYECKITVIYCDTQINMIEEFTQEDLPLRLHAVGHGGTIQKPAYDWIVENMESISAIVHFSDSFVFDWKHIKQPSVPAILACHSPIVDGDTPDWLEVVDISEG